MSIHLRCRSIDKEEVWCGRVAVRDLSRDDHTLLITREGMLTDIQKKIHSIYFVLVAFYITVLVDAFSPIV